ncbi:hypothetical protein GBAR_LOCUS11640 [Geodia barretti]|uniref:Uncharacterized protein n=1 Tax=Geodia barretti TaxID=519541 RepID=A0AA35RYM5_GEOBA|nr:hypothetical protein GBAR_LOCUS11640 [Geodia barretti]
MNQRELNDTQEKLQGSEQLVAAFQESLQQKDQTITDLQQTLSDREQKIEQLQEQGDRASRDQPPQQPVTKPQTTVEAPLAMVRGAAVMHGDTAYFAPADSNEIYSYQNILEKGCWSQLPDNYFENYGLVIISGYLTSIGGWNNGSTATLLSLIREDKRKIWSAIFPPMFTPRSDAACITTESDLVVVGGIGKFFEKCRYCGGDEHRF